jgi:hypothetical protein
MRKYKRPRPPTDNMRRLHVLIDASPCEREAGALSTGASLTVKSVIHRDGSFLPFYSFSVHLVPPEGGGGSINLEERFFRMQFRRYNTKQ